MTGQSESLTVFHELPKTTDDDDDDGKSPSIDPRWREMLYFVLVAPTALAVTDSFLLRKCVGKIDVFWLAVTFSWFCLQTALVANWVGTRVDRSRWWWAILGWTLLLINLQVFAISSTENHWVNPANMLGFAFVSGQVGLAVVWCILGTGSWRIRVPFVVAGFGLTVVLGGNMDNEPMVYLMIGQILATAGCCAFLRWTGFRFLRILPYPVHSSGDVQSTAQFSIRHLFYWTTAVGVLAGIARWVDWSDVLTHFQLRELPYFLWYTLVLSVVSMFATWVALGREKGIVRLLVGVLVLPLMGIGAGIFEPAQTMWRVFQIVPINSSDFERILMWASWTSLAGLFLAGILLVFRADGLRLLKSTRKSSVAEVNIQSTPAI